MKKPFIFSILSLIIVLTSTKLFSQALDIENIKSEIKVAALMEQEAFKKGDCEQVLSLMAADITFLANGNKVPSKEVVMKFCNAIPRPFKTPTSDTLEIYPLTETSGYTIRKLEYPKDDATNIREFVTKIWVKTDGEWKITHLHSTLKETPSSK
ncbi:nuclear transport factor 2 family protein [Subsaxibacter sp. CAU 1640]|uniref:nuclear transport factor 2 family protein n=1 Tax=Subsaxibacter sp. CAU 1640 TaxID=2933271 RepID=UPI002005E4BC|nr:nuclear transport factor 2 family protein [Subsaxibacter sp. CAU 1640]MCK7591243.1 nuclear transport factor 2 family protein [Subsaxibacter sp. CAU 1640]